MCGIAGVFTPAGVTPARCDASRMLRLMAHRGPDAETTWTSADGRYTALFRRLAIIDLDSSEQPLVDPRHRRVLLGNGEIYNYLELRKQLTHYPFRTAGDMETVLALAATKGAEFVEDLNGMYALALYDEGAHSLTLVRDRLGIKPLYWARLANGGIIFASEIKPLLASGLVSPSVENASIAAYLAYGYVPAPATLFAGVHKLPPAHRLIVSADGGTRVERYWFPQIRKFVSGGEDELLALLSESIRLQLRSDVPIGALLSGGLDSGLMVAIAARESERPLKTFTARFEHGLDETGLAREVAVRYGTDHTEINVTEDDIETHLAALAWFVEEPLADPSVLPNFLIEQALSQEVRVALNGTGGDELFAGYPRYFQRADERRYLRIPRPVRSGLIETVVGRVAPHLAWRLARAEKFDRDRGRYLHEHSAWFPEPLRAQLGNPGDLQESLQEQAFDDYTTHYPGDEQTASLYADLVGYLPEDLLLLLDRTSMACSVEGRVPYLDHRLVEAALGLPAAVRTPDGRPKHFQRWLAKDFLPPAILAAPKRGFASPVAAWMSGTFGTRVVQFLTSPRALARGWWTRDGVLKLASSSRHAHRLYALTVLELAVRQLIEAPIPDAPSSIPFAEIAG